MRHFPNKYTFSAVVILAIQPREGHHHQRRERFEWKKMRLNYRVSRTYRRRPTENFYLYYKHSHATLIRFRKLYGHI